MHLQRRLVGIRVVLLAQSSGFLLEQDRGVCLRREQGEGEDESKEDEQDPIDPSPVSCSDADPTSYQGSEAWSHARNDMSRRIAMAGKCGLQDGKRKYCHRCSTFVCIPDICDRASDVGHWRRGSSSSDLANAHISLWRNV